jgi:hypothetical protein
MQKINFRRWITALLLSFYVSSAMASGGPFWFFLLLWSMILVPLGMFIYGVVLLRQHARADPNNKPTWKFYIGTALVIIPVLYFSNSLFHFF